MEAQGVHTAAVSAADEAYISSVNQAVELTQFFRPRAPKRKGTTLFGDVGRALTTGVAGGQPHGMPHRQSELDSSGGSAADRLGGSPVMPGAGRDVPSPSAASPAPVRRDRFLFRRQAVLRSGPAL
ncbi:hypothetical protein [Streptomyces sp. NRRL S-813]|uniref:hypothetical protein n=1 Tax=Streptomyces sp. NRRL S-813 TaxID=1463919 RepID=UPI00131CE361|nr:hypothetical protein [Streptomyces sp. NRRL S-813]